MASMKKTLKKYERPILLGVVLILLATFSVTGAVQCGSQQQGSSLEMGGSFNVSPSDRAEVSDGQFDQEFQKQTSFLRAVGVPSREYGGLLSLKMPGNAYEDAWMQIVITAAAREAGYLAGEHQIRRAVEDMVGGILRRQAQLPYSDVNYQNYLRQNYDRSQADFEDSIADLVIRDQFLYPLVNAARYTTTYAEAYEAWKPERERVNLDYVSLKGTPFSENVLRRETTRDRIGKQVSRLTLVGRAAAQVRRVRAEMEARKKADGAYPESIEAVKSPQDPWKTVLKLEMVDGAPVLTSAGPDKAFGTADDISVATAEQLATRRALFEVASLLRVRHKAQQAWPKTLEELKKAPGEDQLPGATQISKDGWDRELVYAVDGDVATLSSLGPDGQAGTADDISVTLDPEAVEVPLGAGLQVFRLEKRQDEWGTPLKLIVLRGAPTTWKAISAGPDKTFGTEDDIETGNEGELIRFFQQRRADYRLPMRRNFEALLVHLPLVPDSVLRALWEKYPEYRPTDEQEIYDHWQLYKGPDLFYGAEDPADPETGHGAKFIRELMPDATPTLVPAADIFPDPLGDAEKKDEDPKDEDPKDEEKKDEDPKGDEPKDGEPKDGDADESGEDEDKRIFREKGWRQIVIREMFLENVLNGLLRKARENHDAIEAGAAATKRYEREMENYNTAYEKWKAANLDKPAADRLPEPTRPTKPEIPEPFTFDDIMEKELGPVLEGLDPNAPRPFKLWKAGKPLTRKEWEANKDWSDGLKFALDALKTDGQYYGIPVQLHRRKTKVLVRRIEEKPEEDQSLEDVREDVFARFAEWRQMDRAAEELEKLRTAAEEAINALGEDADQAAKDAAWNEAVTAWGKDLGDAWKLESTGLYIGSEAPPALEISEDMPAAEAAAAERRNFIWRTGYGSVEKSDRGDDEIEAAPGTFGRTILRDYIVKDRDPEIVDGELKPKDTGTGSAYLVRVKERVYPSEYEFSPRRYVEWLHDDVFGDLRSMRQRKSLRELPGRINQAVSKWFDNYPWLQNKFKIDTNTPLDKDDKKKRQ